MDCASNKLTDFCAPSLTATQNLKTVYFIPHSALGTGFLRIDSFLFRGQKRHAGCAREETRESMDNARSLEQSGGLLYMSSPILDGDYLYGMSDR